MAPPVPCRDKLAEIGNTIPKTEEGGAGHPARYTQATVRGEKPVLMCEKEGRVLADKAGQDRGQ